MSNTLEGETMKRPSTGGRHILAGVASAALLVSGLSIGTASAQDSGTSSEGSPQIQKEVLDDLSRDGSATVWVRFDARPDMDRFSSISDWDARGTAVHDALTSMAEEAQSEVRAQLEAQGLSYTSYWITNAILVEGADEALVNELAGAPGVDGIYASFDYEAPEVQPAPESLDLDAIEWGVLDINADEVWGEGVSGEGIVVANIDSGVQWDHPALIDQYRGWDGATADHDYNWFDGTGENEPAPWDWDGHGTHTMGTMVGDDGGDNQIGVAPGARWIAASTDLSDEMMFASGEWMLAPTEVGGTNPDPSMRPHVINNSWGSSLPSNDPFMEDIIEAWHAAGQFSVFSNGNEGPGCETSGSPGSRVVTYSVGSYGSSHAISDFSSRGPGQDGEVKPNIAAPGGSVRSSFPGGTYGTISGTSMAAPHVSGAVALLWSAEASANGDVAATRALLDGSAIDTEDLQCGGTAEKNNVFGEGRLNAYDLIFGDEEPPADPAEVQRISGSERYATAAEISAEFPEGVDTVYVANGTETFEGADALAAGAAGAVGGLGYIPSTTPDGDPAPILLVRSGDIPDATEDALAALSPSNIVIVGGTASVSSDVEAELAESADVRRIAGENRYETAALIAVEYGSADTIYVATGQGDPSSGLALADALTAGSLAGSQSVPVVLTRHGALPDTTAEVIAELGVGQIVLVGGTAAVSDAVLAELNAIAPTERASGKNRFETAVALTSTYAIDGDMLYIASGTNFPDALSGSSLTGSQQAPMLITRQGELPDSIADEIRRLSPQGITIFGGPVAVSAEVEAELQALLDITSTD